MSWVDRFFGWVLERYGLPADGGAKERSSGLRPPPPGPDAPPRADGTTYWVYTDEFDRQISVNRSTMASQREQSLANSIAIARQSAAGHSEWQMGKGFEGMVAAILLDHSASISRQNLSLALAIVAVALSGLTAANVTGEIIGYTTQSFLGGKAREKWINAGSPRWPGRLCDILYVVYDRSDLDDSETLGLVADTITRRGLARDNVDGEALEWAARRLALAPTTRRLLIHVSDGAPWEDSTAAENGPLFLANHRKAVVEQIGGDGALRLLSFSIGRSDETGTCINTVDDLHRVKSALEAYFASTRLAASPTP